MLFQQTICLHTICLLREFIVFRQWHAHCNTNMHEKLTVHVVMFWETYKWGESWWSYELGPNFEGLLGWMEAPNQQAILGLKKHSCLSANSLLHNFESSLHFTRLSYAFFFSFFFFFWLITWKFWYRNENDIELKYMALFYHNNNNNNNNNNDYYYYYYYYTGTFIIILNVLVF